jgi:hypothetical protein
MVVEVHEIDLDTNENRDCHIWNVVGFLQALSTEVILLHSRQQQTRLVPPKWVPSPPLSLPLQLLNSLEEMRVINKRSSAGVMLGKRKLYVTRVFAFVLDAAYRPLTRHLAKIDFRALLSLLEAPKKCPRH